MYVDSHVAALDREGRALVAAARRGDLGAPVPTCPGWRLADLLAHIGFVHRWATRYVATAITGMVDDTGEAAVLEGAPPESGRCDWVSQGHAALVGALRRAPSDLDCWTFLPAPSPLAMWARRQAHETTVHRVDAELAAGSPPSPVEPELAADGIDELLAGFFGRPARRRDAVPGGAATFALEAVGPGRPERWTVRVSEGGVEARHGAGPSDVVVRGTVGDLYLLVWHRRPLEGLEVEGPAELFEQVWAPRSVTWA